jgi:hypothetical protein
MILLPGTLARNKSPALTKINASHPLAKYVMYAYFMQPYGQGLQPTGNNGTSIKAQIYDHGPWNLHGSVIAGLEPNINYGIYGREKLVSFGSYIQVPYSPRLNPTRKSITLLARCKSTGTGPSQGDAYVCIRDYSGTVLGYYLSVGPASGAFNTAGIGFYSGGTYASGVTSSIIADNKWHVVCGVARYLGTNSTEMSYYIDGNIDKQAIVASEIPTSTDVLNIGEYVAGTLSFVGSIESLVAFDTALGADWVRELALNPYSLLISPRRVFLGGFGSTYAVSISEAATASDSSTAGLNFESVVVETTSAAETSSALLVAPVAVSEAATASDSGSAVLTTLVLGSDAATADAVSDASVSLDASVSEVATASDTASAVISYPIIETASASETQSATLTIVADVTESASASDSSTGLRALPATATEAATATDSAAAGKRTLATRTEAASATTTQAATKRTSASRTEAASATDKLAKPTVRASIAVSRVEAASAATSQSASGNWARQVVEASSAADETSASYIGNVSSVNEATPATDVVTVLAELNESVTEAASAGDSIDAASEMIASVSEVATATEASGYAYDAVADLVEAITPTDASETTTDLFVDVNEMVAADDASAAYAGQVDIQVEAAAASDLAFAGITVNVSIEEPTDYLLSATDISDWLVVFGRLTGQTRLQPALTSTPAVRPALTHPVQIKPTVGAALRIDSDE